MCSTWHTGTFAHTGTPLESASNNLMLWKWEWKLENQPWSAPGYSEAVGWCVREWEDTYVCRSELSWSISQD